MRFIDLLPAFESFSVSQSAAASLSEPLALEAASRRYSTAWIEIALAVGGFGIGTGEFASMGILPSVAGGLGITEPQAGHMISAYALGVVVGAPVIAVLSARMARRTLLLWLMAIFFLGNAASAMAPGYLSLILSRFLVGLPHGAYFGVACLVVAGLAAPNKRVQAVGRVMLGLTVATLVGTPLTTWFGQNLGWRMAFLGIGSIGAVAAALIWHFLPRDRALPGASPLRELGALRNKQIWLTLAIPAIGFGGMFSVYSYISSTLTQVSGLDIGAVPIVLLVFGSGMLTGNFVGSWLADKSLMATIGGTLIWNMVVLFVFSQGAAHAWLAVTCVFLIGCTFAIAPAVQTRLMDVAGEAQSLAAALNHSAFNIANASGAWLGGVAIAAGYGWASTGWVGALLALGGMVVFLISLAQDRADRSLAQATSPNASGN